MNMPLVIFISLFIALAIFQLILLLYLANKKRNTLKKQQHEQRVYKESMPAFIQFLNNEQDDVIPLPPGEYHVAEQLFSDCIAIIKDEEMQDKIRESASVYLSSYYEKIIKTGDWSSRVNALYYIEDFRMISLQPLLKTRLKEVQSDDEEKQQLLRTLAAIGDLSVLAYLENEPSATTSMFLTVFNRYPTDAIPHAVSTVVDQGSLKAKISLMMYFGHAKDLTYLPFIEEKLFHENPEMRIQSLKAIYQLNYLSDVNLLKPFFHSEIWVERMFSAKIAGSLSLSLFEQELTELLGDPVWWVRYYAADSLMLSIGEIKLLDLSKNHPDAYARNMATQWLTRGKQVNYYE